MDEERAIEGLADADLLDLAAQDGRTLITCNVRDFVPLLAWWASRDRVHAGVLLVPNSIRHEHFGLLVSSIQATIGYSSHEEWRSRAAWVQRVS